MQSLYGLFGESLSHSISPQIHTIIMNKLNIKGYYHLFEVKKQELKVALEGLKALRARGLNITIPYKTDIMEHIDNISDEARRIGSVNTVKFNEGTTTGYNTDYFGLDYTFKRYDVRLKNSNAVILGNGGVAITLVQYLLDSGINEISIVGRDIEKIKAVEKFKGLRLFTYNNILEVSKKDILINCSPCGMYPKINYSPVEKGFISNFNIILDLIYNPRETLFLRYARESGVKGINGLNMLVAQAVYAQVLWNDIDFNYAFIDEILNEIELG